MGQAMSLKTIYAVGRTLIASAMVDIFETDKKCTVITAQ
jgi:hypothetical protein